jgi:hypothetical protein
LTLVVSLVAAAPKVPPAPISGAIICPAVGNLKVFFTLSLPDLATVSTGNICVRSSANISLYPPYAKIRVSPFHNYIHKQKGFLFLNGALFYKFITLGHDNILMDDGAFGVIHWLGGNACQGSLARLSPLCSRDEMSLIGLLGGKGGGESVGAAPLGGRNLLPVVELAATQIALVRTALVLPGDKVRVQRGKTRADEPDTRFGIARKLSASSIPH